MPANRELASKWSQAVKLTDEKIMAEKIAAGMSRKEQDGKSLKIHDTASAHLEPVAAAPGQPAPSTPSITRLAESGGYPRSWAFREDDDKQWREALFNDYQELEKKYRQAGVPCFPIIGKDKQGNHKFHSIQYPSAHQKQAADPTTASLQMQGG